MSFYMRVKITIYCHYFCSRHNVKYLQQQHTNIWIFLWSHKFIFCLFRGTKDQRQRIEAVLLLPQIDTVFYDTMNTINMLLWFRAIYFLFLSGYKKKGYRRICSFRTPDQFIFFRLLHFSVWVSVTYFHMRYM